jgi:DNA uptake protein ComE-like DNA-binding protein
MAKAGVGDLGHITTDYDLLAPDQGWPSLKELEKNLKKSGYGLQRRLPIFSRYVRDNWYSRKLAQMLDKYQLMLKQAEEKEKLLAEKLALKSSAKPKKVAVKASSKK